jgi:hypothetical protein
MKKTVFSLAILATLCLASFGCKKDSKKADDCNALAKAVSDATTAFSTDQSTQNCTALKNAYTAYINSSCITAEEKATAQEGLAALNAVCP